MSKNWFLLSSVAFGVGFGLSLPLNRDIRQALLNGFMAIPATTVSVLVANSFHKRKNTSILAALESEIQLLEERKQSLCATLDRIATQQQQLQQQQDQQCTLEAEIVALQDQRQEVSEESYRLEVWLRELRTQETRLNQSLSALAIEQQQREFRLQQSSEATNQAPPQNQSGVESIDESTIERLEILRATLLIELERLETNCRDLVQRSQDLELQIQQLQQQEAELAQVSRQLVQQKQQLEAEVEHLSPNVATLQQQENRLTHEITELSAQRDLLRSLLDQLQEQVEIKQNQLSSGAEPDASSLQQEVESSSIAEVELQELPSELFDVNQDSLSLVEPATQEELELPDTGLEDTSIEDSIVEARASRFDWQSQVKESSGRYLFEPLELFGRPETEDYEIPETQSAFKLWNPEHARWLWEGVILPRWMYKPFLGSVRLPQREIAGVWGTEDILDVVGSSLRTLGSNNIKYDKVYDRGDTDTQHNWLKILTFAISEYAYCVESNSKFWQGLCDRLNLPYRGDERNPVRTLKKLAQDGIDLLRLPEAVDGYPIVSTLWLQSGIPRANLHHFAELTKDLIEQYGWHYFVQTDARQLAKILLTTCQTRHPGRTVLIRFLEYSCDPTVKPFSAQILQTIATVAIALQQRQFY